MNHEIATAAEEKQYITSKTHLNIENNSPKKITNNNANYNNPEFSSSLKALNSIEINQDIDQNDNIGLFNANTPVSQIINPLLSSDDQIVHKEKFYINLIDHLSKSIKELEEEKSAKISSSSESRILRIYIFFIPLILNFYFKKFYLHLFLKHSS